MSTVYFNDIADFTSNPVPGGKTFCDNFSNNCTKAVCVKFDPAVTTGEAQDATNLNPSTFEIVECGAVNAAEADKASLNDWTGSDYVRGGQIQIGDETVSGHIMQRPGMKLTQKLPGTDTEVTYFNTLEEFVDANTMLDGTFSDCMQTGGCQNVRCSIFDASIPLAEQVTPGDGQIGKEVTCGEIFNATDMNELNAWLTANKFYESTEPYSDVNKKGEIPLKRFGVMMYTAVHSFAAPTEHMCPLSSLDSTFCSGDKEMPTFVKKNNEDYGWYCIPDKDKITDPDYIGKYIRCQDDQPVAPVQNEKYSDVKKIGQPYEKFAPAYNTWCWGAETIGGPNTTFWVADAPDPNNPSNTVTADMTNESHRYLFDDAADKCMRVCAGDSDCSACGWNHSDGKIYFAAYKSCPRVAANLAGQAGGLSTPALRSNGQSEYATSHKTGATYYKPGGNDYAQNSLDPNLDPAYACEGGHGVGCRFDETYSHSNAATIRKHAEHYFGRS